MKERLAAIIVIGMMLSAGSVMATMFALEDYTVNYHSGTDTGLILNVTELFTTPTERDLTAGNSYTFDLFRIGTPEGSVGSDDRVDYDISVDFDWSAPADVYGSVTGVSDGRLGFFDDRGRVRWDGLTSFNFGDGGLFTIGLSNVRFGTPGSAVVQATLNFVSDSASASASASAPVPEPSTILIVGVLMLVFMGYNSKRFKMNSFFSGTRY